MDCTIRLVGPEMNVPGAPDIRHRPMHELRICQVHAAFVAALVKQFGGVEGVVSVTVPQANSVTLDVKPHQLDAVRMGVVAVIREAQRTISTNT